MNENQPIDAQHMDAQHMDAQDAARALDAIAATRHGVAERVGSPPHYYTKLGAGMAALCLAQPSPAPVEIALILVAAVLLGWAIRSYSQATGTWTMATLREPGAWMAWLMIGTMVGALALSMFVPVWPVCIPAAAVSLLVTWYLGPKWDAAWVRSLAAPSTPGDAA